MAKTRSNGRLAKVTVLIPLIKDSPVSDNASPKQSQKQTKRRVKPSKRDKPAKKTRAVKVDTVKTKAVKTKIVSKKVKKEEPTGIISSLSNYIAGLFGM
jgi:hypothetical protein